MIEIDLKQIIRDNLTDIIKNIRSGKPLSEEDAEVLEEIRDNFLNE